MSFQLLVHLILLELNSWRWCFFERLFVLIQVSTIVKFPILVFVISFWKLLWAFCSILWEPFSKVTTLSLKYSTKMAKLWCKNHMMAWQNSIGVNRDAAVVAYGSSYDFFHWLQGFLNSQNRADQNVSSVVLKDSKEGKDLICHCHWCH